MFIRFTSNDVAHCEYAVKILQWEDTICFVVKELRLDIVERMSTMN